MWKLHEYVSIQQDELHEYICTSMDEGFSTQVLMGTHEYYMYVRKGCIVRLSN